MKTSIKSHSKSMVPVLGATLVMLACAAGSAPAMAQQEQFRTRTVAFGDLNLDSEQGARMLYARIRVTALDVCAPLENRELARRRAWQACVDTALATAVAKINQPMVTALYRQSASRPG